MGRMIKERHKWASGEKLEWFISYLMISEIFG